MTSEKEAAEKKIEDLEKSVVERDGQLETQRHREDSQLERHGAELEQETQRHRAELEQEKQMREKGKLLRHVLTHDSIY